MFRMIVLPLGMYISLMVSSRSELASIKPQIDYLNASTGTGCMREAKWGYWPPLHCFFHDLAHIRQFGIVRPNRRSVLTYYRIDFLLGSGLNMGILYDGMDKGQNYGGG